MTLVQLTYIVAVDTYRHFATAAANCHVTQPTLSMQVQKLEEELGIKLFDRSRQPVVPTDLGQIIIEQARIVLREANRVGDLINSLKSEIHGELRLGIIPTLAPYLLPLFVQQFIRHYPKVSLIIEEIQTQSIIEKLHNDTLDAGLLATPLNVVGIIEEPLFYEPFVAYVPKDHPLAAKTMLNIKDLSLHDVLLLNEGHCFREQALRLCGEQQADGQHRSLLFESGNLETLKKLVEQNFGMTLLPYLSAKDLALPRQKKLVRTFAAPVPTREISIIYGRAYLKKHIIEALAREILEAVPEEFHDRKDSYIVEFTDL